jgi:hypothetical protein
MTTERVTMILDEHRRVSVAAETRYRGTDVRGGGNTELHDVIYRGVKMDGTWDGCATHPTIVDPVADGPVRDHLMRLLRRRDDARRKRDARAMESWLMER